MMRGVLSKAGASVDARITYPDQSAWRGPRGSPTLADLDRLRCRADHYWSLALGRDIEGMERELKRRTLRAERDLTASSAATSMVTALS
jgi:hypothetical protein